MRPIGLEEALLQLVPADRLKAEQAAEVELPEPPKDEKAAKAKVGANVALLILHQTKVK